MPQGRPSVGRERYIRIKLQKDTHALWVEAKHARKLKSDDALTCHLLSSVTDISTPLDLAIDGCRFVCILYNIYALLLVLQHDCASKSTSLLYYSIVVVYSRHH